jgi:hypothetical protein
MAKTGKRELSEAFLKHLENGLLQPVLSLVKADNTLSLCIRDEYVNVYYRGGSLLCIKPASQGSYAFSFNPDYEKGRRQNLRGHLPAVDWDLLEHASTVDCPAGVALWLSNVPLLKQTMDFWFSVHHKPEREFQQVMERVNNENCHTDYYIVDIEYTSTYFTELRADMLALWWPRTVVARRHDAGFCPRLTMIEVKWCDGALKGDAGLVGHVEKMAEAHGQGRLDFGVVANEVLSVFKQRVRLGLINCDGKEDQFQKISEVESDVDYLLLIADHDPDSTVLKNELKRIHAMANLPFRVRVATASPMGFGLFTQRIIDLGDALNGGVMF